MSGLCYSFLRCLSQKCASFLPPLQISRECGVTRLDYIKCVRKCRRKTSRNREALVRRIIKTWPRMSSALHTGCGATFTQANICSAFFQPLVQSCLETRRPSANNIFIQLCSRFTVRAITKCTVHANFPRGRGGYFQRMNIDFPLDLCTVEEHDNERSSVVSPL